MFAKILIANRGEIACRVAATARRLGVRTVAVYSDADADAAHVRACDEAVHLGGNAPRESYLRAARLIEAARATGAQAIHPGYGFLSENEDFAQACADAGLVFIGPPAAAIAAMGRKSAAKATTRAAANTSPEPFSNVLLSLAGDAAVPLMLWLAVQHPAVFWPVLALAMLLALVLIAVLFRFLRALLRRFMPRPPRAA